MRFPKLVHVVAMRFSEMDPSEGDELYGEAQSWYKDALFKSKEKETHNEREKQRVADSNQRGEENVKPANILKITQVDKLIILCEQWYIRYGFAMIYIIAVPMIRSYYEGGTAAQQPDNMEDAMKFFSLWQKNKVIK